ncbi:outer membrane protein assembly factor BamA [Gaoshiqia sediminis]|uniref:Outer membrane protein assembly factor BamA n=1 Tax=Gaoshiqia sediminis TaxID=2986998 RepID=A0AA42C9Y2_9BACT|nr:outer membrane protein assembly factor BamA [Gaoshiqia sediminis]MCW0483047.1 outer membrane protein assembly factor BamA [Gaoshiqia sediminis]
MHKSVPVIFLFLLNILAATQLLQGQENYEIRRITFTGNKTLDESVLTEALAIKKVSYLEKLFTKSEPSLYNQELLDIDLERLTRFCQREGFLDASVTLHPPKVNDNRQVVKLNFTIDEGQPVLIDSMNLRLTEESSIDPDSLWQKISRKLELSAGKRFRDQALLNDVQLLEDAFRNLGHAYAKTDYQLKLKPAQQAVAITYEVNPGPLCHVGETSISGYKNTSERFIHEQLEYEEGQLYNKSLLDKTRKDLYQLQLFRVVSVLPETDAATRKSPIPVKLYVEEAPRVSTRFGLGYGTEDQFRTFLDLNYRGFLSGARRINLYLKHSALVPYSASLRWIQPQFLTKNSSLTFNPFISRNTEPGYETRTYGLNVPLTYRFNDQLTSSLTYYFEKVQQTIEAEDAEFKDMESRKFPYNKSGVLLSTVFNNARPQFSPTHGQSLSVGFKLNGHLFGTDFNYTRLWSDFRSYHKLGDWVLAFRMMGGGIASADSSQFIPVEDRFYSGGSNSVRGWNRSELGPKRESGTPLGGKSLLESNLELRYPLFWRLSGVAFLDAGNVWANSYNYRLNDLAYAAGGGIRIDTPIGPIRFDLGFPVWNEKKSPQFFISVGQAF